MALHRGQGAFEYILMLSGVLLVVITITYMMQGSLAQADNTLDAQMKSAGIALDPSYYVPGVKPQFMPSTPSDGFGSTSRPNITALITVKDAALNNIQFNWNGANYSIYDQSLALALNFDDANNAGDTAAKAIDTSTYGNNGEIYGNTQLLLHMDEGSGSTVYDESAYHNNGALSSTSWNVTGKSGSGINGRGVGGSISINNAASLNFGTNSFSVEMWGVFYNYTYPMDSFMMKKTNACYSGAGNAGWSFGGSYNYNGISVCYNDGTRYVSTTLAMDSGYQPAQLLGKWTHLVIVYDRSSKRIRAFVNGVRQTNEVDISSVTGSVSNTNPLTIGYNYGWMTNGTLDEVMIANRTLSAAEVLARYKAGRAKPAGWDPNGKWNGAMNFDGVDDYVNCGNATNLHLNGNFSIEFWAKRMGLTGSCCPGILIKGDSTSAHGYLIYSDDTTGLLYLKRNNAQQPWGAYLSANWQHFAATYDSTSGRALLYANGALTQTWPVTFPASSGTAPLRIAMGDGRPINGSLDEVRIWNRMLSYDEVAMHYKTSLNKHTANAWFFDFKNEALPTGTYNYTVYASGGYRKDGSSETRTVRVCSAPFPC